VRVDKVTYAALEATLLEHLAGRAAESVPVLQMATLSASDIAARAERLAAQLGSAGWRTETIPGESTIGGGSAPGTELPTTLVALAHATLSADAVDEWLRALDPPVIARVLDGRVVIDLRTVTPGDDEELAGLICSL
jgi:L-seryl-tRNA(Ser) seleniumtransferase